jgi:uncharacterized protein (TIGR02246 family)
VSSQAAITTLIHAYESALNSSNTDSVLKLYATDGIFMSPNSPTSIGHSSIQSAYTSIFSNIKLSVTFKIHEIEVLNEEEGWAFARTESEGTVSLKSNGAEEKERNQELFVLRREEGEWKIARYCFASMNPV